MRRILPFAFLFALLLAMAGGGERFFAPTPVSASPPGQGERFFAPTSSSDLNSYCLACHSIPGREIALANGEMLPLHVDPGAYAASIHGQEQIPCTACHTNISTYPHAPLAAFDRRDFQLDRYGICRTCHAEAYASTLDSMHADAVAGGNRNAAICTDCHGAHDITDASTPREKISVTCSKCHAAIFEQYKESVHGAALIDQGNPDVPTCVDCHGVHSIQDPRTVQFRNASPEICGACHRDAARMNKYGISTDVFNTYVADFHGTTVTLFERSTPDQPTNKAVCFDCHGIHNIKAINDPEAMTVKENLLVTCQRCHPDANANFPTSWTSHFIPDPQNNPLVYYINLFYEIFIPGVVGFMLAFVSLDALRRILPRLFRRRPSASSEASEEA